jgi:hypothetical protein
MVTVTTEERRVNNIAIKNTELRIFGIKLYSNIKTTTNNNIVRTLTELSENKQEIKGFNYENKD